MKSGAAASGRLRLLFASDPLELRVQTEGGFLGALFVKDDRIAQSIVQSVALFVSGSHDVPGEEKRFTRQLGKKPSDGPAISHPVAIHGDHFQFAKHFAWRRAEPADEE